MYPEIAIENYVLDYFVNPSQTLRISSGLRLRASAQDHGDRKGVILTLSEAKGKNLIPKLSF